MDIFTTAIVLVHTKKPIANNRKGSHTRIELSRVHTRSSTEEEDEEDEQTRSNVWNQKAKTLHEDSFLSY